MELDQDPVVIRTKHLLEYRIHTVEDLVGFWRIIGKQVDIET